MSHKSIFTDHNFISSEHSCLKNYAIFLRKQRNLLSSRLPVVHRMLQQQISWVLGSSKLTFFFNPTYICYTFLKNVPYVFIITIVLRQLKYEKTLTPLKECPSTNIYMCNYFHMLCRHLSSQLLEMERLIDKMLSTEFERYATADLNRPLVEDQQVLEGVGILWPYCNMVNNCVIHKLKLKEVYYSLYCKAVYVFCTIFSWMWGEYSTSSHAIHHLESGVCYIFVLKVGHVQVMPFPENWILWSALSYVQVYIIVLEY